jgi:hypothetical protein
MNRIGAVFQPELIELMKAVLDDATATLPEARRTSAMKAEIASHNRITSRSPLHSSMSFPSSSLHALATASSSLWQISGSKPSKCPSSGTVYARY